ncbi:MAG: ABC transporter ATP-binding protein [Candidatus Hydrogenedentota bacterium]
MILHLENVSRRYGRVEALKSTTLEIHAGAGVALTGPNGCGKSTLLKIAAGLLRPTTGRVSLFAADPWKDRSVRGRAGYLGHELGLYDELTGPENLRFFAALYGVEDAERKLAGALETAGLPPAMRIAAYSRGMKERLALARAMIHDPEFLLLDEPTTGLDEASTTRLAQVIRRWREEGRAVLVSTHDPAFASAAGLTIRSLVS